MDVIINGSRPGDLLNWTEGDESENATGYGCGNPRFTVQQWTLINLPFAALVIMFFGFFQPRTRLWPKCCGGRPSVAYPVNLLDSYSNRLAFLCAFGVCCIGILDLFTGNYYVEPDYDALPEMVRGAVRSCIAYVNVFAIGLAHYPIMICLTVEHWVVSDIIGILYTLEWGFLYYYSLGECPWGESDEGNVNNLIILPVYVCYIVLFVLFVKRMYNNYSIRKKMREGLEVQIQDYEEEFHKTHYYKRVQYLLTPKEQWERNQEEPGNCRTLFNKIYKNEPGFMFSRRIVCTIGLSALCLYCVGIIYEASGYYLEEWARETFDPNGSLYEYYVENNNTGTFESLKELADTFSYTFSPTVFAAMGTMICYTLVTFIAYRRNTLALWRGDKSFCPKEKFQNTTLVVSSLKYSGYHIAFVLWGFILLQLVLWLFVFLFIYLLLLPIINREENWVWSLIKNQWLSVVVYLFVYYSQVISAKFLFLHKRGKELSIDNRRLFHVEVYFFFFVNVIIGLASCLLRIFKSVLFGLLLVGRIDRCLLMRGFELYDTGFKAYLGFLQLEVAHTHPVVITFCHYLLKTLRDKKEKVYDFDEEDEVDIPVLKSSNTRPRNRWHLAFTLLRNNHLLAERFNAVLNARREDIRRQIKEEKQHKDEEIVKEAVSAFVVDSDDAADKDQACLIKHDSGKDLDGDPEGLSLFSLNPDDTGDEERQDTKGDMAPSQIDDKREQETPFSWTSGYGETPDASCQNSVSSPSHSVASGSGSVSTINVPGSLKAGPSPPPNVITGKTTKGEEADLKKPLSLSLSVQQEGQDKNPHADYSSSFTPTSVEVHLPGTPT